MSIFDEETPKRPVPTVFTPDMMSRMVEAPPPAQEKQKMNAKKPRANGQKLWGQQVLSLALMCAGVYLRHRGLLSEDGFLVLEGIAAAQGVTGASIVPALLDAVRR